jgi:S1-C subfamily serine protease
MCVCAPMCLRAVRAWLVPAGTRCLSMGAGLGPEERCGSLRAACVLPPALPGKRAPTPAPRRRRTGITIAPPQLARQVGEEGVLVLEVPAGTPADKAGFKGTYRCAPPSWARFARRCGPATQAGQYVMSWSDRGRVQPACRWWGGRAGASASAHDCRGHQCVFAETHANTHALCGQGHGRPERPLLGARPGALPCPASQARPLTRPRRPAPRSDEAGRVILGDIIVGIDGRPVRLQRDLFEALDEKRPGDKVTVEVTRDGRRTQLLVTLGGRDITGME